jgi:hypothetical protein
VLHAHWGATEAHETKSCVVCVRFYRFLSLVRTSRRAWSRLATSSAQGKGRSYRRGCNDTERQLVRDRMFGVVLSLARKNRFCPCGHLLVPTESVGAKKPAWNPNSAKITGEVSSWDQYESLMLPCGLALLR